jgi:hypothetical protein
MARRRFLQGGLAAAALHGFLAPNGALASTEGTGPAADPWVDVRGFGATGDGVTDDSAAIRSAIEALGSSGGVVSFPPGTYVCGTGIDLDGRQSVTLVGTANPTGGSSAASILKFVGGGSSAFISAQNTAGVHIRHLMILYTSPGFTGTLIDYRNLGGLDTVFGMVDGCYLGSSPGGVNSAASLVDLDRTHSMAILNSVFRDGIVGIRGRSASSYANRIFLQGNYFSDNVLAHIRNPGQAWVIQANTFEHLAGGRAGACSFDADVAGSGISLLGNWFGDVAADAGGAQISWSGESLLVSGNYIGFNEGAAGIEFVADGCRGIVVASNEFVGWGTCTGIDFGETTGHLGVQIGPNAYAGVSTMIGGTIPDGLVEDTTTAVSGRWLLASAKTVRTGHVGSARPAGGSSGDIKVGSGKLWVNDRGTWKSVKIA